MPRSAAAAERRRLKAEGQQFGGVAFADACRRERLRRGRRVPDPVHRVVGLMADAVATVEPMRKRMPPVTAGSIPANAWTALAPFTKSSGVVAGPSPAPNRIA